MSSTGIGRSLQQRAVHVLRPRPPPSRVHPESGHAGPTGRTPSRRRSVSDVPALEARSLLPRAPPDGRERVHRLARCLGLRHGVSGGRKASPRLGVDAHRDGGEDCVPSPATESRDGPPPAPCPALGAALGSRACPMPRPASVLHGFAGEAFRRRAGPRHPPPPLPPRQSLRNPLQPTHPRRHRTSPRRKSEPYPAQRTTPSRAGHAAMSSSLVSRVRAVAPRSEASALDTKDSALGAP